MCAHTLALADGVTWSIAAADTPAAPFVDRLAAVMQLDRRPAQPDLAACRLLLATPEPSHPAPTAMPAAVHAVRRGAAVHWTLAPESDDDAWFFGQAVRLSALIGLRAQCCGGALVHAALALRPGAREASGILLAAAGGTGKSTAARRLPPPWHALCDDMALVVRDGAGRYWAHPWPTWSRFLDGGPGGSWPTAQAVRLTAIFFLEQARVDAAAPIGPGHAAAALVQSIAQASNQMTRGANCELLRALHLEWFEAAARLAHCIPCFVLQLTQDGTFWDALGQALDTTP